MIKTQQKELLKCAAVAGSVFAAWYFKMICPENRFWLDFSVLSW